jgi:hypothetical protein
MLEMLPLCSEMFKLTYTLHYMFSLQMHIVRTLTMQDSITDSKTINYILFMVFC